MRRSLASLVVVQAIAFAATAKSARADEPSTPPSAPAVTPWTTRASAPTVTIDPSGWNTTTPRDPYAAFPLRVQHDKHYVRAGLEVGGVLAVGLVDYLLNTTGRGGTLRPGDLRWDLRYDWPTLRGKLDGSTISLDSNKFPTNYASHPFAGTLYFEVARSNHLSFAESFLYATLGSTTWEYFGEIRETTSINDLIVTPVSGAALGEPLMQLAGFFDHGKKQLSNDLLSIFFSPAKTLNEWTDGAEPLRAEHTDALGFPTDRWHRFTVSAGVGATSQEGVTEAAPRASYTDLTFGVDTALANLPGYGGAAHEDHLFDDGNMSNLHVGATFSRGQLVDALFATRVVPAGLYVRDAEVDGEGRPYGQGTVVGLRLGFEYGMHDYDRDRYRVTDLVCVVSPLGVAAEHTFDAGPLRVRTSLDVYGGIAGVAPYAFSDFLRGHTRDGLLTPLRTQGYYHAVSVTAAPAVEVAWGDLRWSAQMRLDSFRPIEGVDESEPTINHALRPSDRRTAYGTTLAWTPGGSPLRLAIDAQRRERSGDLGPVHARRSELSAWGSVGVVF